MATRRETTQRRRDLYDYLRQSCRDGSLKAGELLPSVRELSQQHKVSVNVVCEVLSVLVEEGLLSTIPRVGTFIGRAKHITTAPYLMIRPEAPAGSYFAMAQLGFETRLGQLGGASLCLSPEEFHAHQQANDLPDFAGVFAFNKLEEDVRHLSEDLPFVSFGTNDRGDVVDFDNTGGGSQAARHLLQMGHRNIAFLGLHGKQGEIGPFLWSAERESGWRHAMTEAGYKAEALSFQPIFSPPTNWHEQAYAAQKVAAEMIRNTTISAIITANSFAARGLLNALREAGIPAENWPAILCFDTPEANVSVVSCIQQPWDEIGREAAQVLWERHNERLIGEPQQRLVAMRLIPRLTCRADWATSDLARNRAIEFVSTDGQNLPVLSPAGV